MTTASNVRTRFTPRLEELDGRAVPAVFVVRNLADAGAGSLRQAVLDAPVPTSSGSPRSPATAPSP
jgi:hypothetical protein